MKRVFILALVVVGALAMAGPVLAAYIWEWNAGDTCIWLVSGNPSCDANGILMSGGIVIGSPEFELTTDRIYVDHDCYQGPDTFLFGEIRNASNQIVWDGPVNTSIYLTAYQPGYSMRFYLVDQPPCNISHLHAGDWFPDPTPEPTPEPTQEPTSGITLNFSTDDVLSVASMIVASLIGILIIIWGFSLGISIVRKFMGARWGG